jgi:hypothetical protein
MLETIKSKCDMHAVKKLFMRRTICAVKGHRSTGTMLWWMCDRCFKDFGDSANESYYKNGIKITTSRRV